MEFAGKQDKINQKYRSGQKTLFWNSAFKVQFKTVQMAGFKIMTFGNACSPWPIGLILSLNLNFTFFSILVIMDVQAAFELQPQLSPKYLLLSKANVN